MVGWGEEGSPNFEPSCLIFNPFPGHFPIQVQFFFFFFFSFEQERGMRARGGALLITPRVPLIGVGSRGPWQLDPLGASFFPVQGPLGGAELLPKGRLSILSRNCKVGCWQRF